MAGLQSAPVMVAGMDLLDREDIGRCCSDVNGVVGRAGVPVPSCLGDTWPVIVPMVPLVVGRSGEVSLADCLVGFDDRGFPDARRSVCDSEETRLVIESDLSGMMLELSGAGTATLSVALKLDRLDDILLLGGSTLMPVFDGQRFAVGRAL